MQLVRDRLGPDNAKKLSQIKAKLFDAGMGLDSADIHQMIENLGLKLELILPHLLSIQMEQLPSDQIVFVTGVAFNLPLDIVASLQNFAERGGRLIFANCSPAAIAIVFPGQFIPSLASCTTKARLRIVQDKDFFSGFSADERDMVPENNRYPLKPDERSSMKVIAKFDSYYGEEPTLAKFEYGQGMVYYLISKMFVFEPKDLPNIEDYLKKKGASSTTLAAWQCAFKVGYKKALSVAISSAPCLELLTKLVLKEVHAAEQILLHHHEEIKREANPDNNNNTNNNTNNTNQANGVKPEIKQE
jgi:hypothetical protein